MPLYDVGLCHIATRAVRRPILIVARDAARAILRASRIQALIDSEPPEAFAATHCTPVGDAAMLNIADLLAAARGASRAARQKMAAEPPARREARVPA